MLCVPTARLPVVAVAMPPVIVPVPTVVVPSRNETVPLGVPAPGAVTDTAADSVIVWPNTDGVNDVLIVVDVDAFPTTCAWLPDVLPEKLPSPE